MDKMYQSGLTTCGIYRCARDFRLKSQVGSTIELVNPGRNPCSEPTNSNITGFLSWYSRRNDLGFNRFVGRNLSQLTPAIRGAGAKERRIKINQKFPAFQRQTFLQILG